MNETSKKGYNVKKIALAAVLGLGLYGNHKLDQKQDYEVIMPILRDSVYAKYEMGLNPTKENKYDYRRKTKKLIKAKKERGIKSLRKLMRANDVLYFGHFYSPKGKPIDSYYGAKIIDRFKKKGLQFYLTKVEDDDFKGIQTLEQKHFNRAFMTTFRDMNKQIAVNIQIGPLEKDGKILQRVWDKYVSNNELYKKGELAKWDPIKQTIYNSLKDIPKDKIAEAYVDESVKGTVAHESKHKEDEMTNYGPLDMETRAYLRELQSSPLALKSLEYLVDKKDLNKEDQVYQDVAKRIFNGLTSFSTDQTRKNLYKESREEIARRAKALEETWYGEKK